MTRTEVTVHVDGRRYTVPVDVDDLGDLPAKAREIEDQIRFDGPGPWRRMVQEPAGGSRGVHPGQP